MEKPQAWKLDFLLLTSEIYKHDSCGCLLLLLIWLPQSGSHALCSNVLHSERLYH